MVVPRLLWASFFFNDTATPEIYSLSLPDALPICPGWLLWITLVNTKVIQFWKFLYFNSSERCCKLLPSCFSLCSTAFPAIHKQDSRSYFPIVCIAIIKASYFLMFAQTFLEEI